MASLLVVVVLVVVARLVVEELLERIRALSLDLRPGMLDDFGLLPALLWHFDRYKRQTGIRVSGRRIRQPRTRTP